jgi:hypothetical protein
MEFGVYMKAFISSFVLMPDMTFCNHQAVESTWDIFSNVFFIPLELIFLAWNRCVVI